MSISQDIIYAVASQPLQPHSIMNLLPESFLGKFIILEVVLVVISWFAAKSVIYLWLLTGEHEPSKPTFGDKVYGLLFVNLCMYLMVEGMVGLNRVVLWVMGEVFL